MELKKAQLEVTIEGAKYDLNFFSAKELLDLESKVESGQPIKISLIMALLVSKGLPQAVVESLDSYQLQKLFQKLGFGAEVKN